VPALFTLPRIVALSSTNQLLPGAKLTFSISGTSTLQNVYTDEDLTVPHSNPVIADGAGAFGPIYLDPALPSYRVLLTDSDDVTQPGYPIDDVPSNQNQAQTFRLKSAAPELIFEETDAAANNQKWRLRVNAQQMTIDLLNDAESVATAIATLSRSGTSSPTIDFGTGFLLVNSQKVSGLPTVNIQNANYTFVLADANNIVLHSDSSSYTWTIPLNSSVEFDVGTSIQVINRSNANLGVTRSVGVTLYGFGAGSLIDGQITIEPAMSCFITKTATNEWIQSTLTSVSTLNDGYTGTLFGFSSNPTGDVFYRRLGHLITLQINANIQSTTSDSTGMTLSAVPTAIRPANQITVHCTNLIDNGAVVGGWATVGTNGVVTFGLGVNGDAAGFTASGTKGLSSGWTITYPVGI
jgi:hypothetical protein